MYTYNLGLEFQHVASFHGDRSALLFPGCQALSYRDLNAVANRVAHYLLDLGIRPRDVVCLPSQQCLGTYALILACLKIGAPYSILDCSGPRRRAEKIISTCAPALLVLQKGAPASTANQLSDPSRVLNVEDVLSNSAAFSSDDLDITNRITGSTPAYIMFTSGTTGTPSGAAIAHQSVCNFAAWARDTFRITPTDVATQLNPLYFDNSVFDLYSTFLSGACLVPVNFGGAVDPFPLIDQLEAAGITQWFSVPSLLVYLQNLDAFTSQTLPSLRRIIFGGEGFPVPKLQRLYQLYGQRASLFNVYGPTECTCMCSSHEVSLEDLSGEVPLVPLGHIARNFNYMLLDRDDAEVTDGEIGELWLIGPNVGLGYYRNPELTALRFARNRFNDSFPEITYRTGDLVRADDRGRLHFVGRLDNQIKHAGHRIELEEIEHVLITLDWVSDVTVIHTELDAVSTLVAFLVRSPAINRQAVRDAMRDLLPDYMIPGKIVFLDELPRNPNGKVDRTALRALLRDVDVD